MSTGPRSGTTRRGAQRIPSNESPAQRVSFENKITPPTECRRDNFIEIVCKPGSVCAAIYLDAPLPMRSSRLLGTTGPVVCPSTALLRIEFTAPFRLRTMGELLPRLSTLTRKAGGISLLHLSWGHPRRALPVILALWSPDFPHAQAFASCPRLLDFSVKYFNRFFRKCQLMLKYFPNKSIIT